MMKVEAATLKIDPKSECCEGAEAFTRFDKAVCKVLSVPRAELLKREEEYKKQAAANPHKRGPKPKR